MDRRQLDLLKPGKLNRTAPLLSKLVISYCLPHQVSTRTRRDNPTTQKLGTPLHKNAVQAVRVPGRGCCPCGCG